MTAGRLFLSLGLIAVGLVLGQAIKHLTERGPIADTERVSARIRLLQRFIMLGVNPLISMWAFWVVEIGDPRLLALPVLGILAIVLGGALALVYARQFKMSKKQAGAIFTSGSFTNMGTMGGLISYVFFGEVGYAIAAMYRLFEDVVYFTVGYPIARLYGTTADDRRTRSPISRVLGDPFIRAYVLSLGVGLALNFLGIDRPELFTALNSVLIPLASVVLVTTVAFSMRFGAVVGYLRECLAVGSIKFVLVPVVVTTAAYLLGLGRFYDALPLKVVIVMSSMPPAFNSLIPPQIYNLDIDLANSCWLFNMGALTVVLPWLYFAQSVVPVP